MMTLQRTGLLPLICALALTPPVLARAAPVAVTAQPPTVTKAGARLQLSGTVTSKQSADLSARVDGLIAKVLVDAGSTVARGATLLHLDDTLARLELEQAEAALLEATAALAEARRLDKEARRLHEQQHISTTEVASREAAVNLAEAAHAAARARRNTAAELVARHALPAPFAGVVRRRLVEVGEWVTRGTPVLELVALEPLEVEVMVPQEHYGTLAPDQQVTVHPDARPGITVPARIEAVVPVSDSQSRTFLVRLLITRGIEGVQPGTSASVEFHAAGGEDVLEVPRDAVLRHPDGGYSLFVIENGLARRRNVVIGASRGENVAVSSGIGTDALVIVRGNQALRDGQPVTVARP